MEEEILVSVRVSRVVGRFRESFELGSKGFNYCCLLSISFDLEVRWFFRFFFFRL